MEEEEKKYVSLKDQVASTRRTPCTISSTDGLRSQAASLARQYEKLQEKNTELRQVQHVPARPLPVFLTAVKVRMWAYGTVDPDV